MTVSIAESITKSTTTLRRPDTKTVEQVSQALIDYRGKTPPKSHDGVKLITAKVIKDGRIWDGEYEYVTEETYTAWMTRGFPHQGDILITTEAPLGEVARLRTVEKVALAQRVILLRGNPEVIDQGYYFYALQSPFVKAELAKRATGTTVLGIKQSELRQVNIPYPPLPTQRKIASILSAYDDLIENNTRRIAILESMAQMLYREWFVHFRFPGHATYKMIDSPLGPIPEGWRIEPLGSVYSSLYDGPHATPAPSDTGPVFLGIRNMTESGKLDLSEVRHIAEDDFPEWTRRVLPQPGDIVFTYEAALHRYAMVPQGFQGCLGRRVALIRPNPQIASCHYLLRYFLSERWHKTVLQHVILGATVDRIPLTELPSFEVLLPPAAIQRQADVFLSACHLEIQNCMARSVVLQRTRDLLLPKLISGEVSVEQNDIVLRYNV